MTGQEAALHAELEGYERKGMTDRAEQVRAQLDLLAAPPAPPEPVSVTDDPSVSFDDPDADADADSPKPKPRRSRKATG